jgi:hypothetical protein
MDELDDRWTIEELIARYELEAIRDAFVEGSSDRSLVEWFLKEYPVPNVTVYEINSVDVPYDKIKALSLEDNNRGRVITLASSLEDGSSIDLYHQVACIADTDFDYILEKKHELRLLILTHYSSVETYLFDAPLIDKFLALVVRDFPYDGALVLDQLTPTLNELFLIRLANQHLELGIKIMPFDKCCTVKEHELVFDADEYVSRYLSKGAALNRTDEFVEVISSFRARFCEDRRMYIHGHDFIELLRFYVTKIKKPRKAYDLDFFTRSLFGVVELKGLGITPLFSEILRRFA